MYLVKIQPQFEDWRRLARQLLYKKISPDLVKWSTEETGFSLEEPWREVEVLEAPPIDRSFLPRCALVSSFRDDSTWSLLYRLSYRLIFENRSLLQDTLDQDVLDFESRERLVSRDMHKMKAFVRFKEVEIEGEKIYVAWHRPDHRIVKHVAPFFRDRFNGMKWMIMTEDESVSWDRKEIKFSPGVSQEDFKFTDEMDEVWSTYYQSIFNPARIKISAMKRELPVRHWETLPETRYISQMLDEAPRRLAEFANNSKPGPRVPKTQSLEEMNEALKKCRACGICPKATSPVPGEGSKQSRFMIVGEQPGDEEDRTTRPFVGPSGKLLDQALLESGIAREKLYLTNSVKGFKFIPKDKLRWHRTPHASEVSMCKPWLQKEIDIIQPELIIGLGRTAGLSLLGKMVKMEEVRGKIFKLQHSTHLLLLPHPASILRTETEAQAEAYEKFLEELDVARKLMK